MANFNPGDDQVTSNPGTPTLGNPSGQPGDGFQPDDLAGVASLVSACFETMYSSEPGKVQKVGDAAKKGEMLDEKNAEKYRDDLIKDEAMDKLLDSLTTPQDKAPWWMIWVEQ